MNEARKKAEESIDWCLAPPTHRPIRDLIMALNSLIVCRANLHAVLDAHPMSIETPVLANAILILRDCIQERSTAVCGIFARHRQLELHATIQQFARFEPLMSLQIDVEKYWEDAAPILGRLEAIEAVEDPEACRLGAELSRILYDRMTESPADLNDHKAVWRLILDGAESSFKEMRRFVQQLEKDSNSSPQTGGRSRSDLEEMLLAEITDEIQTARQIFRRAGLKSTGQTRGILAQLVKNGLCESRPGPDGGFCLPRSD